MAAIVHTPSDRFLRRAIQLDIGASGAIAAMHLAAARPLAEWLALPAPLLRVTGVVLAIWCAYLLSVLSRARIGRGLAWSVIGVNAAWVVGSLGLLFGGLVAPNALGMTYVAVQAAGVAVFAELQFIGLRRLLRG